MAVQIRFDAITSSSEDWNMQKAKVKQKYCTVGIPAVVVVGGLAVISAAEPIQGAICQKLTMEETANSSSRGHDRNLQ